MGDGCEYCENPQYWACERDFECHHGCEHLPAGHSDLERPCEEYE
jgi:hypothetical protein